MATLGEYENDQRARRQAINVDEPLEPVEITISEAQTRQEMAEMFQNLLERKARQSELEVDSIQDVDWVGASPYEKGYQLELRHKQTRIRSSADRKFEDTSLGGNYVCNPRPGFTPYADIPRKGLLKDREDLSVMANAANLGMGDVYSRMIDSNYHVIDLRFGKPEYNSIFGFSTTAYSAKDALLANTGNFSGFGYVAGQGIGLVAGYALLGVKLATGVLMVSYAAQALRGVATNNPHKFWYVRPQMTLYWRGVHNMVNEILTFRTLVTGAGQIDAATGEKIDGGRGDDDVLNELRAIAPDYFDDNGGVNVRRVINRAERLNQHLRTEYNKAAEQAGSYEQLKSSVESILDGFTSAAASEDLGPQLFSEYLANNGGEGGKSNTINNLLMGTMETRYGGQGEDGGKISADNLEKMTQDGNLSYTENNTTFTDRLRKFWKYFETELSDGSSFASFRVDHIGPVSESFSNSTMKNDLASKFNEISATGRAAHFTLAGGNILPGMGEIMGAVKSIAAGVSDALKIDGLIALAGSAYMDVPDMWENSAFDPPSTNYQFRLVSPSPHPFEQLQFIWIPLAMIINGVIPHAAGKASYTQPFFCELYDRGRAIVRNGMITQLLVTRGVSNLGFTQSKDALAVDVQFTVKNLSSANYMPLENSINLNPLNTVHAYDSTYSDYIAALGSATLGQNVYKGQKLRIRLRNYQKNSKQLFTMDHWAGFFREMAGINNLDLFYPDSGRGG